MARAPLLLSAACLLGAASAGHHSLVSARHRERFLQLQRAASLAALPVAQWYNQTADHFNVASAPARTWLQRFWVNDAYYAPGSPLFLYVEGEGAGSAYDAVSGQHVELAANHSALVIALEHRFYGASLPGDLSVDNLGLLSSHQAIADVGRFLREWVPAHYNVSRTVTFGGSYPGALSAWLRLRLPSLVFAAFSTSSPVKAVVDFTAYCDVVSASLADPAVGGSPACLSAVKAGFAAVDAAFRGSDANKTAMSAKMSSCAPALSPDDVMWAASNLAGQIMGLVQYNAETGGPTIASSCATMTAPGAAPVDALAAVIKSTLPPGGCQDNSYADFIAQLRVTTPDPSAGGVGLRQWTWQVSEGRWTYRAGEVPIYSGQQNGGLAGHSPCAVTANTVARAWPPT
jgi:serine protease 16